MSDLIYIDLSFMVFFCLQFILHDSFVANSMI